MELGRKDVEIVARALLGDPNRALSKKDEWRFGSHGSVSVDLSKGVWHSHEEGIGGGILDLIAREKGLKGREAFDWLRGNGIEVGGDAPRANGASEAHHNEPKQADAAPRGDVVATFDYVDENGDLVFQVCRIEDGTLGKDGKRNKTFLQRRPDPQARDGWTYKVAGTKQVPFHLIDLIEAISSGYTVFICEGEKAVNAIRSLGFPATCNAGGAGKWPDSLTPYFADADVVILPDDDPQARKKDGTLRFHEDGRPVYPGMDHAMLVASKLEGVARRIRVLSLTDRKKKEDAFDWVEQGGTADLLFDLVETRSRLWPFAPDYVSKFGAVPWNNLNDPAPEHEWLIKHVLTRGERSMVVGASQSGKTFAVLDMAMCIARGQDYFGKKTLHGGVIYQAGEGARGLRKRIKAYRKVHDIEKEQNLPFVLLQSAVDLYGSDDHTNLLILEIKHWASTFSVPLELVVIDTLSAATPGANENSSEDVSRVLARCARISDECHCHVMLVHHMNAGGTKERGHSSIKANLDSMIVIEKSETSKDADNRTIRTATLAKMKDGDSDLSWRFVLRKVTLGYDDEGDPITSCVIETPAGAVDQQTLKTPFTFKSDRSRLMFGCLIDALRRNGMPPPQGSRAPNGVMVCRVQEWRDEFFRKMPSVDGETEKQRKARVRTAMHRAIETFQTLHLIGIDDDRVWLTGRPVLGFNLYTLGNTAANGDGVEKAPVDAALDDEVAF